MAAREFPLEPGDPQFAVWFAPELENELADHPSADELVDEISEVLSRDPQNTPGRRTTKIQGAEGLWRYRPKAANDLRILFAIEEHYVMVLSAFPRKTDYRPKDLKTAVARRKSLWAGIAKTEETEGKG